MKWLVDTDVIFAGVNQAHVNHPAARKWLDAAKAQGWAVSVETFLAVVRLLMNPNVMKGNPLRAREALRIVRNELSGGGRIILGNEPDDKFLGSASGHRQVMDFYLVQTAAHHALRLATFDHGTLAAWPKIAIAVV